MAKRKDWEVKYDNQWEKNSNFHFVRLVLSKIPINFIFDTFVVYQSSITESAI